MHRAAGCPDRHKVETECLAKQVCCTPSFSLDKSTLDASGFRAFSDPATSRVVMLK